MRLAREERERGERGVANGHRLLKRLSQKGQREVEMERKEQGFSLYLNGANTAPHHHHHRSQPRSSAMTDDQQHPSPQSQSRPSWTAGKPYVHMHSSK